MKLNDGLEDPPETTMSPKPKQRHTHLPSRSGPSCRRQKAQKIVTSPPAQVLATLSSRQKTGGNVDGRPTEISGVQLSDNNLQTVTQTHVSGILQQDGDDILDNEESEISGVQVSDGNTHDPTQLNVSGVQ